MKVVNAGAELITEPNPLKKIEYIARTCYKSEFRIKDGSDTRMVRMLVNNKHYAMLEHASIIFKADLVTYSKIMSTVNLLETLHSYPSMLRFSHIYSGRCVISGNMRAWLEYLQGCKENNLTIPVSLVAILTTYTPIFDEFEKGMIVSKDKCSLVKISPSELIGEEIAVHVDITVKFICDRGVSHELVRHRIASFAQESTRYCNYSGEVTFIRPIFFEEGTPEYTLWEDACEESETIYQMLLDMGRTPQEARDVLSTSVKTEVVMTANYREWKHFFDLRVLGTTGKPHPQMKEVAEQAMELVHKQINEIIES